MAGSSSAAATTSCLPWAGRYARLCRESLLETDAARARASIRSGFTGGDELPDTEMPEEISPLIGQ